MPQLFNFKRNRKFSLTLKRDYVTRVVIINANVHTKGRVYKSERGTLNSRVNIVIPRWLGSDSFALHRRVQMWTCEQRGPQYGKDGFGIASLSRSAAHRASFPSLFRRPRLSHSACEKTDILRTVQRNVWNIARANTGEKFSVESISARSRCRSDLFPFFLFFFADLMRLRDARYVSSFLQDTWRGEISISQCKLLK